MGLIFPKNLAPRKRLPGPWWDAAAEVGPSPFRAPWMAVSRCTGAYTPVAAPRLGRRAESGCHDLRSSSCLDAACPQRAMPLFRIPRVGDDSAHVVWKRPATGRRRRHAPRDPPRASSTATTLPVTFRVLRVVPSSPRRSHGSHAPLILVAATSSRAPREQGRRCAAAGSANAADPSNYTSSIASFASRSVTRAKVPIASRRRVRSNHTRPALIQGSPPVAQRSVAASMDRSSASAARADMSIDR